MALMCLYRFSVPYRVYSYRNEKKPCSCIIHKFHSNYEDKYDLKRFFNA